MKIAQFCLDVQTWKGISFNAEHFYGKFFPPSKPGSTKSLDPIVLEYLPNEEQARKLVTKDAAKFEDFDEKDLERFVLREMRTPSLMSWRSREKPQPKKLMSELPENSKNPQKAVANDALFGVEAERRRAEQLELNCTWLVDKIDRIHAALCPGQHGTWQQRAEQAVKAAESLPPNASDQPALGHDQSKTQNTK